MYKVTLAMPVYNAAHFIERSLLSAMNQTFPEIEFLIIDDKGQDNSMDIICQIVSTHARGKDVRVIDHIENRGIGATRNTAMDNASGEYLFFMDNDDEITLDCVEKLYNKMIEHPVDFVAASFVRRDMEGNIFPGCSYKDTLIEGGQNPVAAYRYVKGQEIFVASWNKLYRLDFLKKNQIHCMPYHLNEDPWFTYQVILSAKSCHLLPDCTLFYSLNPKSVSGLNQTQGYTERICRQYVEIQKLKSKYITHLTHAVIYPGLLVDLIFISVYHSYRILSDRYDESSCAERKRLAYRLLSRDFLLPSSVSFNRSYFKFLIMYSFFSLPVALKLTLIRLTVKQNLRFWIKRWIHF